MVMFVDDDESVLDLLGAMAEESGMKARCATSGADALRGLLEERPEAIALDLNMPGLNGLEIVKILKEHRRFGSIPVFMLTGEEDPEIRRQAGDLGVAGYLVKSQEACVELMQRLLEVVIRARSKACEEMAWNAGGQGN